MYVGKIKYVYLVKVCPSITIDEMGGGVKQLGMQKLGFTVLQIYHKQHKLQK